MTDEFRFLAGQPSERHEVEIWEQGRIYGHLEAELKICQMFGAIPAFRIVPDDEISAIHMLASKFGYKAVPSGTLNDGKRFVIFEKRDTDE